MAKKAALSKYLPFILIAGGAAALYFYFKPKPMQPEITPPPPQPPVLPPAGSTPPYVPAPAPAPEIKPLMIGQSSKVKTGVTASGFITRYKGSIYPSGGNKEGLGGLKPETYSGIVKEIDPVYKSVRVENFTYPMKDSAGNKINSYWLNFNDLQGNY